MTAPDVIKEIERNIQQRLPLLLQAVLREAFVKSGKSDVIDWCDGKTLRELVGLERAKLVYGHPESRPIGGYREKFAELQGCLNFCWWKPAILLNRQYDLTYSERENDGNAAAFELLFKAGDRTSKSPIDPAHWP